MLSCKRPDMKIYVKMNTKSRLKHQIRSH